MPISIKARKQKARELQKTIRDDLKRIFHLSDDDVRSTSMGVTGSDVQLSSEAKRFYPFSIECKCQENINVHQCLGQAITNAEKENLVPQLIFKRNRSEIFIVMRWDDWIKIYSKK